VEEKKIEKEEKTENFDIQNEINLGKKRISKLKDIGNMEDIIRRKTITRISIRNNS